ncbi:MAG: polysaccharide biosynthesis tyrosine autokinase [Prevotella copri]|nr:polysaccharide biosynthesis tyrosine autokinase [Segatella copri]
MKENKNYELEDLQEQEEQSALDFQTIYSTLILNWKWFLLSIVLCCALAVAYVKLAPKVFQSSTKILIKDDESKKSGGAAGAAAAAMSNLSLGFMSSSNGIDNETEILNSRFLVQQTIKNLKLYAEYKHGGMLADTLIYAKQEVNVDMDTTSLKQLNAPMKLTITREGGIYHVKGKYFKPIDAETFEKAPYEINKTLAKLPAQIRTKAGTLTLTQNPVYELKEGTELKVEMISPFKASKEYFKRLTMNQTKKTANTVELTFNDESRERGVDFLNGLIDAYNYQANIDKNEIQKRTEDFINSRLAKISTELTGNDTNLEKYKQKNRMVDIGLNAKQAVLSSDQFDQELNKANMQVELLNEIGKYMDQPANKYQPIPTNVGLEDESATALIGQYNSLALTRKQLLHSASEDSPVVTPITAQLEDLMTAIKRAMFQARINMKIQRNSIADMASKYEKTIGVTPEQEKALTQIGRQQSVTSGLYLMLLQKREETSMSLASTADKAKIIEPAAFVDKVSPKGIIALLIAFILGVAIPAGIIYLRELLRSKILGHDDVEKLTQLPIIGDIPTASANGSKGNIVIQENKSNLMSEIFRGLRTNLQLAGDDKEKVFIVTSTTTGEGKTFIASNLAMSLALLEKKTIMVGLDIRKPRMAELFSIGDRQHGITNILANEECNWEEVKAQIVASGVNHNLDLLTAGPTPANPGELMVRKSLKQTIALLKEHYDYVIIDTAPVGLVADTLQLSKLADRTLFVCRADFSTKSSFTYINKLDEQKKLPNISIVINDIDLSKKKFAYSYGFCKYSKNGNRSFGFYGLFSNNTNDDSIKI